MINIPPTMFREHVFFRIQAMQESMVGATLHKQVIAYRGFRAQLRRQVELIK